MKQTIPQFEAEGSQPFQYQTRTKTVTVNSYWQLPARLFDDSRNWRLGEGGVGRGATRGVAQAAEGAQGGEEGCVKKPRPKKPAEEKEGARKVLILRSALRASRR